MSTEDDAIEKEIIKLIARAVSSRGYTIEGNTNLFTDIDIDSLQMLEISEAIRFHYGIDLILGGSLPVVLSTPKTIAAAISAAGNGRLQP